MPVTPQHPADRGINIVVQREAHYPAAVRSRDASATSAALSQPRGPQQTYDLHFWSGWRDSNPRPPAPKAGALTKLRHIPQNRR
jgi:hypothetical protein